MGWTSCSAWESKADVIEELTKPQEWGEGAGRLRAETLAKCVRGNVLYAVKQYTRLVTGEVDKFLFVALMGNCSGQKGVKQWGYKDMEESMGPCDTNCPPSYFDMVGPPPNEYAAEWRKKCIAHANKFKRKPLVGEVWSLPGCNPNRITITKEKPLRGVAGYVTYRISKGRLGERLWVPSWGATTVKDMMKGIKNSQDFGALPILADALEEAGCQDEKVLAKLRLNGDPSTLFIVDSVSTTEADVKLTLAKNLFEQMLCAADL